MHWQTSTILVYRIIITISENNETNIQQSCEDSEIMLKIYMDLCEQIQAQAYASLSISISNFIPNRIQTMKDRIHE